MAGFESRRIQAAIESAARAWTRRVDTIETHDGDKVWLEQVACNLCGSRAFEPLYRKRDTRFETSDHAFQVGVCGRCGLGYLNPRPARQSMDAFYPTTFFSDRDSPKRRRRYEQELALLPPRVTRLLDVGCANGDFAARVAARGIEVEGLEVAQSASNRHGLVIHGGWQTVPDASFDCVTAWAVLEHLHDPMEVLRHVARVLRPGGCFVFLVPNFASPASREMRLEDTPRHLYFYTPETSARYLQAVGLQLDSVRMDTEIYARGHRGYLNYRVRRALGREFRPCDRRKPLRGFERGEIGLAELLWAWPCDQLDRALAPAITRYFLRRDRHDSMIVVGRKPASS
ncbi:MAG: class I SAM-dependent methyltransferase [Proteobacteria bacterium]|nr:class I SAM-dependent methyltransferase [Pseudomonadota bacterium]